MEFFEPKIIYARERELPRHSFTLVLRMYNHKHKRTTYIGGVGVLADLSFKEGNPGMTGFEMHSDLKINWISYNEIRDLSRFIEDDVVKMAMETPKTIGFEND